MCDYLSFSILHLKTAKLSIFKWEPIFLPLGGLCHKLTSVLGQLTIFSIIEMEDFASNIWEIAFSSFHIFHKQNIR